MDNDTIKTYSYRISQATRSQLVVITYDIITDYLNEAMKIAGTMADSTRTADDTDGYKETYEADYKNAGRKEYNEDIHMAMRGIDQLITGLDMNYEMSVQLFQLYNYMKRSLISVQISADCDKLKEITGMLGRLRAAFLEVSRQDDSQPLMKNTEKVYSGLTYSRYGANETAQDTLGNRGYKV